MKAIAVAVFLPVLALTAVAQPYEGPDTLWTRVHGFPELDSYLMGDAVPLSDGGVMVLGHYVSPDESEDGPCLTRLDSEGNLLWRRPSHDSIVVTDYPNRMCEISPGRFLLAAPLFTETRYDPCLTLCDEEGAILWQRVFHLPNWQFMRRVRSRGDGTAVVAFCTDGPHTGERVAEVIKVNDGGDSLWRHTYPFLGGYSSARSIAPTSDGGYALLASGGGTGEYPILLFKLDADGNVEFSRSYRFLDESGGLDIVELTSGNFLIGGYAMSYQIGYLQALALLVSSGGDSLWSWLSSPADAQVHRVIATADGGFACFVVGDTTLVRFASSGELLWQRGYSLADPYVADGHHDVFQDAQGRFRVVWDAYSQIDDVPYLAILVTQPDPVAVTPERAVLSPADFGLTVFPNPFNSITHLEFTLPFTQQVSLRLYDVLGREVAVMMDEIQTAGRHEVMFDASGLPSGVYLCRLEAGGMGQTRKMVLIK